MRERIIKYSMLDYVITEEKKKKGGVNTLMRKARVRTSKIDKATVWFLLPLPRALRKMNFLVPIS